MKLRRKRGTTLAGVCTGLGEYFGIHKELFQLAFVLLALFTDFPAGWVYIILWAAIPQE